MAVVDIVEDALGVVQSHDALAKTLGVSKHDVLRVLQRQGTLAPAAVIRAARLTRRNTCDALREAGETELAQELESLLRATFSPSHQGLVDDLTLLPADIRRHFVELIARYARSERIRILGGRRAASPPAPTRSRRG